MKVTNDELRHHIEHEGLLYALETYIHIKDLEDPVTLSMAEHLLEVAGHFREYLNID